MLRASLLLAACSLMALPAAHAQAVACTDSDETWLVNNYQTYVDELDAGCSSDTCATTCEDAKWNIENFFPHCTYHDGTDYRAKELARYECATATVPGCTTDEEDTIADAFITYEPNSCVSTPCETACYVNMQSFLVFIPYCTSSDGNIWYDYYYSLVSTCQVTETTEAPELAATSSESSVASNSTDTSAATTETPTTESSASAEAATTESTAASEESETTTTDASGSSGSSPSATPTPTPTSDAVASSVGAFAAVGALAVATILA